MSLRNILAAVTDWTASSKGALPLKATANADGQTATLNVTAVPAAGSEVVLTPTQITKATAAAGTPEILAGAGTYFHVAIIKAVKALRVANTGTVYLGGLPTNDSQPIDLAPGDEYRIEAPPGYKLDLANFYLDVATAADAVTIIYW